MHPLKQTFLYWRHKHFKNKKFIFALLLVFLLLLVLLYLVHKILTVDDSNYLYGYYTDELKRVNSAVQLPPKYLNDITAQEIPFNYTLLPLALLKSKEKHTLLTFFIKSAPSNFARRKVIRETWGKFSAIGNSKVAVVFLIGGTSQDLDSAIQYESDCFKDILQTTIYDSFQNLTLKTLSAFKFIISIKWKSSYHVFADDDCVVNLSETISYFETKVKNGDPTHDQMHCGFQYEAGNGVIRGYSKYSVTWAQYPSAHFPPFCRGVMVILTEKVIHDLYIMSRKTDYASFPLEDIMVYGILRTKLNDKETNIAPVINGAHPLVFYPWDNNSSSVVPKMLHKWQAFKQQLEMTFPSLQQYKHDLSNCNNHMNFLKKLGLVQR